VNSRSDFGHGDNTINIVVVNYLLLQFMYMSSQTAQRTGKQFLSGSVLLRRRAPGQDESTVNSVPGGEFAIHYFLVSTALMLTIAFDTKH